MSEQNKILQGKCEEILKDFPDNYFDSCVTDPPYGISFMNKHWDYELPTIEQWKEIIRVLKPGGHLLCACGTRTQHRMAVNIEDAGFEIRDIISWIYGSGFPKSLDVSKAIDKQAGAEREIIREAHRTPASQTQTSHVYGFGEKTDGIFNITTPSTEAAKQWEGWGTALKPAQELWTLARKPLSENTVAQNVLKYGTGGINIDGSRIEINETNDENFKARIGKTFHGNGINEVFGEGMGKTTGDYFNSKGRFPANVILDEFMGAELDKQTGILTSGHMDTVSQGKNYGIYGKYNGKEVYAEGDSGGASRFFYCPKADNFERNKGLKEFEKIVFSYSGNDNAESSIGLNRPIGRANTHPTVKPIDLMRYLVKLITPKKGICLDPFCGSGTTLIGCKLELINFIGIDTNEDYCKIAEARVAAWNPEKYIPQTLFA